jgi:O-antigen ligase
VYVAGGFYLNREGSSLLVERYWTFAVALTLAVVLICGGISVPSDAVLSGLVTLGILSLITGIIQLFQIELVRQAKFAVLLVSLGIALVFIQLIPLPHDIWSALPGRGFVTESYVAAGVTSGWAPLSLNPPQTRADILAITPAIALFIAGLTIKPSHRTYLIFVVLVTVLIGILLALAQKFPGLLGSLYLYGGGENGAASGLFSNRNFFAALLYSTIPFIVTLAVNWVRSARINRIVGPIFAFIFFAIIVIGLGAAESRMGIILASFAILLSIPLIFTKQGQSVGSRGLIIMLFVAVFLVAQFGLVAILRLAATDPVSDFRTVIFSNSFNILRSVFPVGSGFGSFVPLYAMQETPSVATSAYVNHAHNDWLELVLEGGIPAALLLLAYLAWFFTASFQIWSRGRDVSEDILAKAASISIFLLLCHSFVDYPLRTPALMGLFAMLNGFLALGPQPLPKKIQHASSPVKIPIDPLLRAPKGEFQSSFKNKTLPPKIDD